MTCFTTQEATWLFIMFLWTAFTVVGQFSVMGYIFWMVLIYIPILLVLILTGLGKYLPIAFPNPEMVSLILTFLIVNIWTYKYIRKEYPYSEFFTLTLVSRELKRSRNGESD